MQRLSDSAHACQCAALLAKPLGANLIRVLFLNIREEAGRMVLSEPALLVRVQTAADPEELLRRVHPTAMLVSCGASCPYAFACVYSRVVPLHAH